MSEITKDKKQRKKDKNPFIWFCFAGLVIAVYFWGLNLPLLGPDEPRYAQVAREMFERGDWITPKLAGFDWFEKPALLYWLQIASFKIFGVGEFAARFGSALFGLGTILSLWILGRQWSVVSGQLPKEEKDLSFILHPSSFANRLALIAASSFGLIVFSHAASFDIILTFPVTASLVGFFLFDQSKEKSGHTFYLCLFAFYFFIGVALIAKGLVGIIFPLAIVSFYYVLSWKFPSKTFVISLFWGTILSLLVASVWYLPMYQANSWKFIDEFFIQHHFQRYTSDKYQHPQPFWFFFAVLPLMTIPWLPFFLGSIWRFFKDKVQSLKTETRNPDSLLTAHRLPLTTFAFAWMLVPLVFFSLSGSKLPGYVLPALPGALILTAEYIFRFVQNNPRRKFALQLTATVVFISVIVALQFFIKDFTSNDTVKNLLATANAQGYADAKILNLHIISYNAEFYGAGRILRNDDGTQKRFEGVNEIYDEIKSENKPVLVLTFPEHAKSLIENNLFKAKVLADNGDLAIVAVENR